MTPAEAAHTEALRRIRAAKASSQHWLDLGDIRNLERLPEEIGELTELRELGLGVAAYDPSDGEWHWDARRRDHGSSLSSLTPLKCLDALQVLDLTHTGVTDLDPLATLRDLRLLNIRFTKVYDLKFLSGLRSLTTLNASHAPIADIDALSANCELRVLDLSFTKIHSIASLGALTKLQRLNIGHTEVFDLSPLHGLREIIQLDLRSTNIEKLDSLSSLASLRSLTVGDTRVARLNPLSQLSSLEALDLRSTHVSNLSPITTLFKLKKLNVRSTKVCNLRCLSGLQSMVSLDAGSTGISNLRPLEKLVKLESLNISSTRVRDIGVLEHIPGIVSLNISSTFIGDLSALKKLKLLKFVDVGATQVADLMPIKDCYRMESLNIASTKVKCLKPMAELHELKSLDARFTAILDLRPISRLRALESLNLRATLVDDLLPLRELGSLRVLDVSSTPLKSIGSLEGHPKIESLMVHNVRYCALTPGFVQSLPALQVLYADQIQGVPPEVLSENEHSNCMGSFRSWLQDLEAGEAKDQEIKIFVLGNGTAGKTQICRQLRGEAYDEAVPSTHGVQIDILELTPDKGSGAIQGKLWDFGGQDIYHGTHALFLEGRAVFILVWTPNLDAKGAYVENGLPMHHHGLAYWLDYVRSLAGDDAALVVVQSKCDQESSRAPAPLPATHGFKRTPPQVTCSAKCGEMDELKAALRSAARYLLEVHGSYRLPTSWVAVRDRLRKLKTTEKTLSRERFEELCRDNHKPSNPTAVLNYLHRCGEVFHREGLFRDEIVLDQEWAVRAIYAVLDRNGPCQTLRQLGGVFTLPLLDTLVWHGQFSEQEQQTLLGMMASCAVCFPLDAHWYGGDQDRVRRYALPDFLPLEKDAQARVEALWRPDLPVQKVTLEYAFLHAGILRQLLCQIGTLGGADAAYWRYGCCFYDAATHSRARLRAEHTATAEAPAKGRIIIETCDGQAAELLARLQKAVLNIRIGQPPQVVTAEEARPAQGVDSKPLEEALKIAPAPLDPAAKPQVWLSYSHEASEELVGRLEKRLLQADYDVRRDASSAKVGSSILDFEREVGRGAQVIVVLTTKYLESFHCMRELVFMYHRSQGSEADFLKRVVPLVLEDVKIKDDVQRLRYSRYWVQEHDALDKEMSGLPRSALGSTPDTLAQMQQFYQSCQKILAWLADVLMPRGIKAIEEDNFAAVLEALKAKA